jgi:phosphoglycolate phosphatase
MNRPYQLVVFDWEGTIADTAGMSLHLLAKEAEKLGFGTLDLYRARRFIHLDLIEQILHLFPNLDKYQQKSLLLAVQDRLEKPIYDIDLIPGFLPFVHQLQQANIALAIATNKGQQSLHKALIRTGLDQLFTVTRSAGQVPPKPCPQMLQEIMEEFGQTPASTIMIGDSPTDMEMAKRIDVTAVGIDFYHRDSAGLLAAGAVTIVDNYPSLATFLQIASFHGASSL